MLLTLADAAHPARGRRQPGIFPPPAELQRLEMLRDFDPQLRRTLSRMWIEIKVR
ncbi:MAG: hypothetical protein U1A72_09195 [Sulfuritalea sp.]|nr:hypothetical protein [Sulfuritalea sp.]